MDSIQHTVHGIIIVKGFELFVGVPMPAEVYVAGALGGAIADAGGEAERLTKRNRSLWNWYNTLHTWRAALWSTAAVFLFSAGAIGGINAINATAAYLLAYALHLWLDSHTHQSMGAKRNWYPPSEMWRENLPGAVARCWPNWLGWGATIIAGALLG